MLTITMYQCEICKEIYHTKNEAIKCEERGKEKPLLKAGDMVDYLIEMGGGWDNFYTPLKVGEVVEYGHYIRYTLLDSDMIENGEVEWYEKGSLYGESDVRKYIKGMG